MLFLQIKICRNLRTFWRSLGKKSAFWVKKSVFRQEVHYYMVYIAYFIELNLQICDYAQKRRICRKNCNYAFDENFHGHFCPPRKAAKFCHPVPSYVLTTEFLLKVGKTFWDSLISKGDSKNEILCTYVLIIQLLLQDGFL